MDVLLALYLAHLIGDYLLQTDWIYRKKLQSWCGGLFHALGVFIALAALFWVYFDNVFILGGFLLYTLVHYIQDGIKINSSMSTITAYFLDQFIHYFLLTILWYVLLRTEIGEFWIPLKWVVYGIVFLISTYFWDVTKYVLMKPKTPYVRDYKAMTLRMIPIFLCILVVEIYMKL